MWAGSTTLLLFSALYDGENLLKYASRICPSNCASFCFLVLSNAGPVALAQACAVVLLQVLSLAALGVAGQSAASSAPAGAAAPSFAPALSAAPAAALAPPPRAATGPVPAGTWGAPLQQSPGYNGTGIEVPYSTFNLGDVRSPLAVHASLALTAGFGIGGPARGARLPGTRDFANPVRWCSPALCVVVL